MLNELITLTDSYEFEEYGTVDLVAVRKATDVLTLSLELSIRSETVSHQVWEVDCVGVLEHRISIGACNDLQRAMYFYDRNLTRLVLQWPCDRLIYEGRPHMRRLAIRRQIIDQVNVVNSCETDQKRLVW